MDHCMMRPSLVGRTVTRLRKQACWFYTPQAFLTTQRSPFNSSAQTLSWRHSNPGAFEAVAGIAQEAQHEVQQQRQQQQQQRLAETALHLKPGTSSSPSDREPTGAFARLPMVPVSSELIESALKRAAKVSGSKKVKNEAQKARSKAASQMDTLTKEVCVPLGKYMKGFPPVHRLHPFETAMLELTWGTARYEQALAKVDSLRKSILQMGKGYAGQANKAGNKADAACICEEGFKQVESVYLKSARAVDDLKQVAQNLRRLPVVDPIQPVVALVGAPNVGKSSLVNVLSSGVPEVCDYPFTTRSIKMGHFFIDGHRHQVTDTPGLLNRPLAERNAMERLTLACLQHLPSTVLFVLDLTAQCGTSVADQLAIREALLTEFPGKLWLDVLSKADLLEADFQAADAARVNQEPSDRTANPQQTDQTLSHAETGSNSQKAGITETQIDQHAAKQTQDNSNHQHVNGQTISAEDAAVQIGAEQSPSHAADRSLKLEQQAAHSQNLDDTEAYLMQDSEAPEQHATGLKAKDDRSVKEISLSAAASAALLLPNAIRISSVTQFGIQHLQQDVTKLLARHQDAGK